MLCVVPASHVPRAPKVRVSPCTTVTDMIETPKVCRGLAARLQKELARYEPELWKVLKMEEPV